MLVIFFTQQFFFKEFKILDPHDLKTIQIFVHNFLYNRLNLIVSDNYTSSR